MHLFVFQILIKYFLMDQLNVFKVFAFIVNSQKLFVYLESSYYFWLKYYWIYHPNPQYNECNIANYFAVFTSTIK